MMEQEKKEYKNNLRVVNLSTYETPKVEEKKNDSYVCFGFDGENDYFDKLVELFLNSPTNATCINGITDMIFGRGLDSLNSSDFPSDYVKMKKLFKSREIKKLCKDYYLLGQGALQLTYNEDKSEILKVSHFPMETLRANVAEKGIIKKWHYHPNWTNKKRSDKTKVIPSFGFGNRKELNEIYIFKPYFPKFYYYSPVKYQGCLQYAELEGEVSEYHISNIQNGLAPSLFVNFNNGIPDDQTQQLIENKINDKFSGSSNAGRAMIAFNDDKDSQATIEPIHLPDAHAQYQFLSDEAREKIMLGHKVVSPILLGIKDNTGFGNNAEELRTASVLMDKMVVRSNQDEIIQGLKEILSFNDIHQDIYFVTLQPIEFTASEKIATSIKREEETGEKLSSDKEQEDFSEEEGDDMFEQLEGLGEVLSDDWELVYSEVYEDGKEELKLADIKYKDGKSKEDNDVYKVRYAYLPVRNSPNSRSFCKKMESLTSKNIVFRKEDINMMSFRGVNKQLGHKGRNYSLLKFKGGKNCHHYWELQVYRKKSGKEVKPNDAYEKGLDQPKNPNEMPVRPIDMPNRGGILSKIFKK